MLTLSPTWDLLGTHNERTRSHIGAYVIYTTVITGLIYPVVVHWVWDGVGWASSFNPDAVLGGAIDFGGSGVVHMTGGIAAFWGALIIGPRAGRFDLDGTPVAIRGHSSVLQALGTFILWMGWCESRPQTFACVAFSFPPLNAPHPLDTPPPSPRYGFNPGSTLAITPTGYAATAARATICTTLSAAFGGMTVCSVCTCTCSCTHARAYGHARAICTCTCACACHVVHV